MVGDVVIYVFAIMHYRVIVIFMLFLFICSNFYNALKNEILINQTEESTHILA